MVRSLALCLLRQGLFTVQILTDCLFSSRGIGKSDQARWFNDIPVNVNKSFNNWSKHSFLIWMEAAAQKIASLSSWVFTSLYHSIFEGKRLSIPVAHHGLPNWSYLIWTQKLPHSIRKRSCTMPAYSPYGEKGQITHMVSPGVWQIDRTNRTIHRCL